MAYDPGLRLYASRRRGNDAGSLYEGTDAIAEYNGSNALQRRFVFDPTTSQPVVQYEGTGHRRHQPPLSQPGRARQRHLD